MIEVTKAKVNKAAELADRNISNSTTLPAFIQKIEDDAREQLGIAYREYNRATEELVLTERKVLELSCPWWTRFGRWLKRPARARSSAR